MRLRDLASTSFVALEAASTVADATAQLAAAGAATHVVVHAPGDRWYLLGIAAARERLGGAPSGTVGDALALASLPVTVALEADLPPAFAPPRAIVVSSGRAVGFIDRLPEAAARPTQARPPVAETTPGEGAAHPREGWARAEPPEPSPPGEPPIVTRGGGARARRGADSTSAGAGPVPAGGTAAAPLPAGPQRAVEAEFPDRVRLDSVSWLLVYITTQAPSVHGLGIDAAPGETLDILVQPRAGFAIEGEDDRGSLTVPASGESLPVQFKLRATALGAGSIRIVVFRQGEPLGVIALEPTVEAPDAPHARTAARAPRRTQALASPSPQLPDLTMFVEEWQSSGQTQYRILLSASDPALDLNLRTFGPFTLRLDPGQFFADFFKEIDDLPVDTPAQRDVADRRLAAKGAYLSDELLPDGARQTLWEVRDRIQSIVVQSEEPWIPWELCRLVGKDGDRVVEGPFLCEAYTITRWLPGTGFKRPLTLRNLALVVPGDSGLPLSGAERDYVLSLAGGARHVTAVPATFGSVEDAFAAGSYDGWHFTGHGAARDDDPDRSRILLEGGDAFTPDTISGAAANVGLPHPLVFINACQVGRGGMALTGIGGWASRFVEAGAGAFIGAYWSVFDEPACDFARQVYTRLLDGVPIGRAVRDARLAIRAPGDPTWLAYTVFADPMATIAP